VPVLVFCFCPSSVHVVATFSGTVLFPLLCSVLRFSLIHRLAAPRWQPHHQNNLVTAR
jgi:hypothetical protein